LLGCKLYQTFPPGISFHFLSIQRNIFSEWKIKLMTESISFARNDIVDVYIPHFSRILSRHDEEESKNLVSHSDSTCRARKLSPNDDNSFSSYRYYRYSDPNNEKESQCFCFLLNLHPIRNRSGQVDLIMGKRTRPRHEKSQLLAKG
jgi:hypothetical protein